LRPDLAAVAPESERKGAGPIGTLRNLFLGGVFLLVPGVITVYVLNVLFSWLDSFSQPWFRLYLGQEVPWAGVVLTIFITLCVGAFANMVVGQKTVEFIERQIERVPVVRGVYSTTRQVVRGFSSADGMNFQRTVMVRREDGSNMIGFVTNEVRFHGPEGTGQLIAVYLPTNHLYLGDVLLLPPERVVNLDLTLEEGISALLSCGGSLSDDLGVLAGSARPRGEIAGGPKNIAEQAEAKPKRRRWPLGRRRA
jgi:uncharacterized membrane protein